MDYLNIVMPKEKMAQIVISKHNCGVIPQYKNIY